MHNNAAQIAVEEHLAIFFSAALVPQEIQNSSSDLWGEGFREVVSSRHETQQTFSSNAALVEALCDVKAVGNRMFFKFKALFFKAGNDLS